MSSNNFPFANVKFSPLGRKIQLKGVSLGLNKVCFQTWFNLLGSSNHGFMLNKTENAQDIGSENVPLFFFSKTKWLELSFDIKRYKSLATPNLSRAHSPILSPFGKKWELFENV